MSFNSGEFKIGERCTSGPISVAANSCLLFVLLSSPFMKYFFHFFLDKIVCDCYLDVLEFCVTALQACVYVERLAALSVLLLLLSLLSSVH